MRRAITFAILMSMAVLAPTPALLCEMSSSQIAECKTAKTKASCDGMDMQVGIPDDVSQLSYCCLRNVICGAVISESLMPESQYKSEDTGTLVARLGASVVGPGAFLIAKKSTPVFQWQAPSPPTNQSLFCTFLV